MAYNTGNPLGSKDPRDLYDNAENLDKFINGPDPMYPDRFGGQKISLEGMNQEFDSAQEGRTAQFEAVLATIGYSYLGDYAVGLNFTTRQQYMIRSGLSYVLDNTTALPYTTTGVWATEETKFKLLSADQTLRVDLANTADLLKGAALLGYNAALAYATGTVGAAIKDFGNTADLLKGAGLIGYNAALEYPAGTIGNAVAGFLAALTALDGRVTASEVDLEPLTATVASNALTLGIPANTRTFRSSTVASGAVNSRTFSALSLIVPSGATLGSANGVISRLMLLSIDSGTSVELAVINLAGKINLDESGVINTVAIDAAADLANVAYSTTARAGVPYRIEGYVELTQATAGTWATAPSKIQPGGGEATGSMASIGYGQTWADVKASRASGTTYLNNTGKPIFVSVVFTGSGSTVAGTFTVDGVVVGVSSPNAAGVQYCTFGVIVPHGSSYSVTLTASTFQSWAELR